MTNGVSLDVAMRALLEMDEEALRSELQDPKTAEDERPGIRQQLE